MRFPGWFRWWIVVHCSIFVLGASGLWAVNPFNVLDADSPGSRLAIVMVLFGVFRDNVRLTPRRRFPEPKDGPLKADLAG